MQKHFVYLVECRDGTLYAGYTTDLARRVEEHNGGKVGARYTRGRGPVRLRYSEALTTRGDALKREAALKRLPRAQKLLLTSTKKHLPS
ncbi:MAG: GIY-YIG nuclease family protein [Patescibacteria group bacterium]